MYGNGWQVERQHAQGNVLRVWAQNVITGERRFVTVPLNNERSI